MVLSVVEISGDYGTGWLEVPLSAGVKKVSSTRCRRRAPAAANVKDRVFIHCCSAGLRIRAFMGIVDA
jgi:hypothetical protein